MEKTLVAKQPKTENKYAFVDALRGMAIILVLIAHNYLGFKAEETGYPSWFGPVIYQGVYGVQLFYMMSAFTLFLSLSYQGKKADFNYKSFFIRRFFRIAPLFYVAIFYFVVKGYLNNTFYDPEQILSTITFTHGFSPLWINGIFPGSWSIAIEMPFYLLIPFLFYYIRKLDHAIIFFSASVIFSKGLTVLLKHMYADIYPKFGEFLYFYLPAQLPVFVLGIILFYLFTSKNQENTIKPLTWLSLGLIFVVHFVLGGPGIIPHFVLLSIGFLVLVYALMQRSFKLFVNPVTVFIGKISYGIYLFHWAVFDIISEAEFAYLTPHPTLNFLIRQGLILLFCIAIAFVLHVSVEKPFMKIGLKADNFLKLVKSKYAYSNS